MPGRRKPVPTGLLFQEKISFFSFSDATDRWMVVSEDIVSALQSQVMYGGGVVGCGEMAQNSHKTGFKLAD